MTNANVVASGLADSDKHVAAMKRRTTLVMLEGGGMAQLSAHLASIDLSPSVFYTRVRQLAEEAGDKFVSPFVEMGPGLQSIAGDSDLFAESDGGGRSGKFVCVFADNRIVECREHDLDATKLVAGFVAAIRVSGRWCLETEAMSEKYPELKRKPKADESAEAAATSEAK